MSWIVFLLTCRCQSDFLYIQPTPWPIQQLTESKSAAWKHPLTAESEWSRAMATRNIQQPDKLQDFSGLTAAMDTSKCLKSSCQNCCFVLFVKRRESTTVHVLTIFYIWLYTFVSGPTCCMSMSTLESHITSQWKVFLVKKVMDNPTGIQIQCLRLLRLRRLFIYANTGLTNPHESEGQWESVHNKRMHSFFTHATYCWKATLFFELIDGHHLKIHQVQSMSVRPSTPTQCSKLIS